MKVKRSSLDIFFYGMRAWANLPLNWWKVVTYIVYNADSVDHGIPAMPIYHLLIDRAHASLNRQLDDRFCQRCLLPSPHLSTPLIDPIQLSTFVGGERWEAGGGSHTYVNVIALCAGDK